MHLLHLAPLSPWKGKTSPVSDSCDPSMSPKTVKLEQCRTCRLPSHNFKNASRFWTRDGEWERMGIHGNLDCKYFGPFWNARFFQDAQKLETIQKSLDKAGQWHLFGDCQLVWKARIKPAETDDIR